MGVYISEEEAASSCGVMVVLEVLSLATPEKDSEPTSSTVALHFASKSLCPLTVLSDDFVDRLP
jgi:hypothetical protein